MPLSVLLCCINIVLTCISLGGIRGKQKGTVPHVLTCGFENMKLPKCHLIKTQNCELQCPSLQGAKNKNSERTKLIAKG